MSGADASVPERGDVMWIELDPQAGHEQAGHRPALVLSPSEYNGRSGLVVVCPITNQVKGYPFEVPLPPNATATGAVLADQIKSLDWRARGTQFKGRLDESLVNDVVAFVLSLIDPQNVFGASE